MFEDPLATAESLNVSLGLSVSVSLFAFAGFASPLSKNLFQ